MKLPFFFFVKPKESILSISGNKIIKWQGEYIQEFGTDKTGYAFDDREYEIGKDNITQTIQSLMFIQIASVDGKICKLNTRQCIKDSRQFGCSFVA